MTSSYSIPNVQNTFCTLNMPKATAKSAEHFAHRDSLCYNYIKRDQGENQMLALCVVTQGALSNGISLI